MWRRKKKCERRLKKNIFCQPSSLWREGRKGGGGQQSQQNGDSLGVCNNRSTDGRVLNARTQTHKTLLTLEEKQNKKSAASTSHLLHHAEINDQD